VELKFSGLSPYVRKVNIVAHEHGLAARIQLTPLNTRTEPEKLTPLNPLGKIPVLITDAGDAICDSPVICEYLDAEFGHHRLLPAQGARRWQIMTAAALADGLLDAALLVRHERARPAEQQSVEWTKMHLSKVHRALDHFEGAVDTFGAELTWRRGSAPRLVIYRCACSTSSFAEVAEAEGPVRHARCSGVLKHHTGALTWRRRSFTSASASSASGGAPSFPDKHRRRNGSRS
jgi:glutathione S-transferase